MIFNIFLPRCISLIVCLTLLPPFRVVERVFVYKLDSTPKPTCSSNKMHERKLINTIPPGYCHNQVVLFSTGRNSRWPGGKLDTFCFSETNDFSHAQAANNGSPDSDWEQSARMPHSPVSHSSFFTWLWNSAAPLLLKNPRRGEQRWVMVTIDSLMFLCILPWVFFCQANIRLSECSHVWQTSQVIYYVGHTVDQCILSLHFRFWWENSKQLYSLMFYVTNPACWGHAYLKS